MVTAIAPLDRTLVDNAVAFHGHMCPGLALGIQAARIGLREIGANTPERDVVAVVETNYCPADAIQALMGCTFGTFRLILRDWGKQAFTFFDRTGGRAVRVSARSPLQPSARDAASEALVSRVGAGQASPEEQARFREMMQARAQAILAAAPDDLFAVTEVTEAPPVKQWVHPSFVCGDCGEGVIETRLRRLDGHDLCIPCFTRKVGAA